MIGTSDYLGFVLPGIVAFTVIGNGVSSAMPLLFDKETGYLDKLLSLPIARSSIIVSRFVQQLVLGSGQVLLVIIVAAAIGVDIATGPAGVLVILLAAGLLTLAVTSAFLALAYYVPGHGTFFAITGFATLPMVFLSNAFVPLEALPGWMAAIARLNPLTYAIEAIRLLVLEGWTAGIGGSIGALTIAAAVLLGIGTHQFRRQTGERVG